jgi:hypothetical protein
MDCNEKMSKNVKIHFIYKGGIGMKRRLIGVESLKTLPKF